MTKAEKRAMEIYPIPKRKNFIRLEDFASAVKEADKNRINFIKGYGAAQNDTIEQASKWWYEHLVKFLGKGLAESIVEEFKQEIEK